MKKSKKLSGVWSPLPEVAPKKPLSKYAIKKKYKNQVRKYHKFKNPKEYVFTNVWNREEYGKYLLGKWWREIRFKKLISERRLCERCGAKATEVHHKHYNTLGRETLDDLEAICKICHNNEHS